MEQSDSEMLAMDESAPEEQPEKKKTRHWAAWTRDEEELFFVGLRDFGKNFESITTQVGSKNKNQVRHYYYRLIKRMNKLLDPELFLDARNPKDVNAAMLHWWTLLGKYKCSYSKLHLKPRRLKAFVSALELLLRKDKKKSLKKPQKEPEATEPSTSESRKKARTPRKKKKPAASGTYSLAMVPPVVLPWLYHAGVPATPGFPELDLAAGPSEPSSTLLVNPNAVLDPVCIHLNGNGAGILNSAIDGYRPEQMAPFYGTEPIPVEKAADPPETMASKFKLQLFPLDDSTKTALEQDGHNPHLELTLKASKSITSVLHHLGRKWGLSRAASGELRLFPYNQTTSSCSWGLNDANLTASDVHAAVGSPGVFRLKYGWTNGEAMVTEAPTTDEDEIQEVQETQEIPEIQEIQRMAHEDTPPAAVEVPAETAERRELRETGCTWLYEQSTDGFGQRLWQDEQHGTNSASGMDWINRLTANISSASASAFVKDEHNNRQILASATTSSIWGGDDACDAFSFKHREQQVVQVPPIRREPEVVEPLLGSDSQGAGDILRSSALDLYWADSLGDGNFGALTGQAALLNGNSSLGAALSSLFPDNSLDFPSAPKNNT